MDTAPVFDLSEKSDAWMLSFEEGDGIDEILESIKPWYGSKYQFFISVSDVWLKKITIGLPCLFSEEDISLLQKKLLEKFTGNYDFDFLYQDTVKIDDKTPQQFLQNIAQKIANCLGRSVGPKKIELVPMGRWRRSIWFILQISAICRVEDTYNLDPESDVQNGINAVDVLLQSLRHPMAHLVRDIQVKPA